MTGSNYELYYYNYRSHCNHNNHKGDDTVFTSEAISDNGREGVRFRQHYDACGDPNEMTAVAV